MANPRVLILRAPGTNCDRETAHAFQRAGAQTDPVHVNRLLENPSLADRFQVFCIPGGFSYGDDVAAGKILANQLQHHLAGIFQRYHDSDKLVLGICNGFQVLLKAGVLVPEDNGSPAATLAFNDSGRFEDRWVHLAVEPTSDCVFLQGIDRMQLPVAHAEGKFVCSRLPVLQELETQRRVALRYAADSPCSDPQRAEVPPDIANENRKGTGLEIAPPLPYPTNPNGSVGNIAGICDATGHFLGLMPHPERHIDAIQHPRWTRQERGQEGDGMKLFRNAVAYFA